MILKYLKATSGRVPFYSFNQEYKHWKKQMMLNSMFFDVHWINLCILIFLISPSDQIIPSGGRPYHWLQSTLIMLRLPLSKTQGGKDFWKPSKPCHVGIHWIALAEYSQMCTHVSEFQLFFRFFTLFCIGQFSHQQH